MSNSHNVGYHQINKTGSQVIVYHLKDSTLHVIPITRTKVPAVSNAVCILAAVPETYKETPVFTDAYIKTIDKFFQQKEQITARSPQEKDVLDQARSNWDKFKTQIDPQTGLPQNRLD